MPQEESDVKTKAEERVRDEGLGWKVYKENGFGSELLCWSVPQDKGVWAVSSALNDSLI